MQKWLAKDQRGSGEVKISLIPAALLGSIVLMYEMVFTKQEF